MNPAVHRIEFSVPPEAIDANGHVNNVEYMRWMQTAAISHAEATGATAIAASQGATWVVRSHHVEYLRPLFLGDRVVVLTWISTLQRASSLRKYRILRADDGGIAARGETNWVFVDVQSGRPRAIPPEIIEVFTIVSDGDLDSSTEAHSRT